MWARQKRCRPRTISEGSARFSPIFGRLYNGRTISHTDPPLSMPRGRWLRPHGGCEERSRMSALSISELTTYRWSFEEDIARFRDAGFRAVGVWRQKLAEYGEDKGVELLAESGLAVSNLLWCGGFTGSEGRSF